MCKFLVQDSWMGDTPTASSWGWSTKVNLGELLEHTGWMVVECHRATTLVQTNDNRRFYLLAKFTTTNS